MSEIKSKIGLTPKGAYSSSTTYDYLDYVTNADGTYTSKKANNVGHALTETDWWEHDFISPKMRVNATTKNWEVSYDGGTTYTDTGMPSKGTDAVSPQLKIDSTTFNWMLSTDGGATWTDLGVASKPSVVQKTGTSITDVMSQKAITDVLVTKAYHGYPYNPKTLKQVDDLKENSANKQNNLTVDGTGTKFPTVDAVNAGLVAKTAVKQTTGPSTTDVMSQKAITDALANNVSVLNAKENSANKQNSLTVDGTGTKFPTVDAVNAGLDKGNLILDYTYSGNKEVNISAYDPVTGIFTSAAHGLKNGDGVCFIAEPNVTYPLSVFPDSVVLSKKYFVVSSTTDSFNLSESAGGAAILFGNTTINLSSFHLEVVPYSFYFVLGKTYSKFKMITISHNALSYRPSDFTAGHTGWRNGNNISDYHSLVGASSSPTVTGYSETTMVYTDGMVFTYENAQIVYNTSKTANVANIVTNRFVSKETTYLGANQINFYTPVNGQRVLIYKI